MCSPRLLMMWELSGLQVQTEDKMIVAAPRAPPKISTDLRHIGTSAASIFRDSQPERG